MDNGANRTISDTIFSETIITQIVIGITLALILVEFWRIFIEALVFDKLGLNKNSAFQTLVVAVALTITVIILINFFRAPANDIILGVNPDRSSISKTQDFLGGSVNVSREAVRCDCRNCDTPFDRYNPETSDNNCRKNKCYLKEHKNRRSKRGSWKNSKKSNGKSKRKPNIRTKSL